MTILQQISVKGRSVDVPFIEIGDVKIICKGKLLRTAEIFDEYWVEKSALPDPLEAFHAVRGSDLPADIFAFTQRVPDQKQKYDFTVNWDNIAVIPLETYDKWFKKQISSSARRNIKASIKRGVEVRIAPYDEDYVRGIMSIYNETQIRQGRKFWHYGKDFNTVQAENGTYKERSTYLAAYVGSEMIGYLKMVWDLDTVAIMQILSKFAHYDKRPNNALLAAAVEQACLHNRSYLLYEQFVYGKKEQNSLTDFKKKNGFVRMDIPRYFLPLSFKGKTALKLSLHKNPREKIPPWMLKHFVRLRADWYRRKET